MAGVNTESTDLKGEGDTELEEKLMKLLEKMKDWEKTPTSIPGIRLMKIPKNRMTPARLAVEITPVDETGRPIKRKSSIIVSNYDLFLKYKKHFDNDKVHTIIKAIDRIRNRLSEECGTDNDIVFEI